MRKRGLVFIEKPSPGATQLILLGALNPSPERVAGIFIEKPLLRNNAVNPPCNLEITELIHHNRFKGWTVNIPLFEALGPLYFIINKDFDDHVAPEDIGGT